MSYAPAALLDVREYIAVKTGLAAAALGIVGDQFHDFGYHLGKDRLPAVDYSRQHPRDIAGLTNAASALDIGNHTMLRQLCAWMVAEARAGRRPDTREIIGPSLAGRAYRWARENGWRGELRPVGDGHETHVHESYYRDSEYRDKIQYFRGFWDMSAVELWGYKSAGRGETLDLWGEKPVEAEVWLRRAANAARKAELALAEVRLAQAEHSATLARLEAAVRQLVDRPAVVVDAAAVAAELYPELTEAAQAGAHNAIREVLPSLRLVTT